MSTSLRLHFCQRLKAELGKLKGEGQRTKRTKKAVLARRLSPPRLQRQAEGCRNRLQPPIFDSLAERKETKATSALSKKLSAPNYIQQKGKAGPLKSVTKCLGATAEPFLLHCQAFSPLKEPFGPTELLLCVLQAEKAWVFSATVSRLPSKAATLSLLVFEEKFCAIVSRMNCLF